MNYRERIVYDDLKGLGYEVSQCKEKGYPDFKVFSFKTTERFYVEVKSNLTEWDSQVRYHDQQKDTFANLIKENALILIAVPRNGVLEYKNFSNMALWRKISYGTANYEAESLTCLRCGHKWLRRNLTKLPAQCPKCKNAYWHSKRRERV